RSFRAFFFRRVTWLRFWSYYQASKGVEELQASSAISARDEERPLHFLHKSGSFRVLVVEALVPRVFLPPGHGAALVWSYYQASKGLGGLQASSVIGVRE
ncbi:unnamed protein product, partial [Closterium sp. Naga37s-1]